MLGLIINRLLKCDPQLYQTYSALILIVSFAGEYGNAWSLRINFATITLPGIPRKTEARRKGTLRMIQFQPSVPAELRPQRPRPFKIFVVTFLTCASVIAFSWVHEKKDEARRAALLKSQSAADYAHMQYLLSLTKRDSNSSHIVTDQYQSSYPDLLPLLLKTPYPTDADLERALGKPDRVEANGERVWMTKSLFDGRTKTGDFEKEPNKMVGALFNTSDGGLETLIIYFPSTTTVGRTYKSYSKVVYRREARTFVYFATDLHFAYYHSCGSPYGIATPSLRVPHP
jgi:hypothetical protein